MGIRRDLGGAILEGAKFPVNKGAGKQETKLINVSLFEYILNA